MENENVNEIPVDAAVETPVDVPVDDAPVDTEAEVPAETDVETPVELEPEVPQVPQTVPVGVVKRLREEKRFLAEEVARLRQATIPAPAPPTPPVPEEKSPLELFAEVNGEDCTPDAKTLIAQKKFETQQTEKRAQQAQYTTQMSSCSAGIADARLTMTADEMGEGLGFDDVMTLGGNLLTAGDQLDLFHAGHKAGKECYRRVTQRILQSGGKQAQILRARLDSRAKQLKEKPQQDGSATNPVNPKPQPKVNPTQAQILQEFKDPHINRVFGMVPASEE
jgi:hypothetical protein